MACTYDRVMRRYTPWKAWYPTTTLILGDSLTKYIGVMDGCGKVSYPGATIKEMIGIVEGQVVAAKNVLVHVGTNSIADDSFIDDYIKLVKTTVKL